MIRIGTRICPPLKADHPLVTDPVLCIACGKPFNEGDRTVIVPSFELVVDWDKPVNIQAFPVHTHCALKLGFDLAEPEA